MLTICGQQEIQHPVQTETQDGELSPSQERVFHSRTFWITDIFFSCNPAAGVIQNVRLSLMIFLQTASRFAHVNPQIWLDNMLNNSGWSHSPDLAAAAIWRGEEESASAYLLHLLKEEEFTPSVAPIDFEPFVFCRPWIASRGWANRSLQMHPAAEVEKRWVLGRMWQIQQTYTPQCCHICVALQH